MLLRPALAEEDPDAPAAHHEKAEQFAHQARALVVLISAPVEDHKIPVWEQQLSCGAAGMNLLLAAHALGYVARLGDRLAGLFARASARHSASRASGSPASSSSAIPAHELEERPRPALDRVAPLAAARDPDNPIELFPRCCIMTA